MIIISDRFLRKKTIPFHTQWKMYTLTVTIEENYYREQEKNCVCKNRKEYEILFNNKHGMVTKTMENNNTLFFLPFPSMLRMKKNYYLSL